MEIGKLTNEELKDWVIGRLPPLSHPDLKKGAGIGIDCAMLEAGGCSLVLSSDPITTGGEMTGTLAIHVSCNDIAASGVRPVAVLLVLLAPPAATMEDVVRVVDQAGAAAASLGVDIIGGHTEITDAVNRVVVTTTALGLAEKGSHIPCGMAKPGDSLLMTKTAGIEGAWIASDMCGDFLREHLTDDEFGLVRNFWKNLSVVEDGAAAVRAGTVHLMHDVTEGGILGAAHEMASLSGLGLVLDADAVPVHPVTRKICDAMGVNPLRLISSGSLLIATPNPQELIDEFAGLGILCTRIGTFVSEGYQLVSKGKTVELTPPVADELYKMKAFS